MKEWSKNDCNQFKLDILFTGPVIHDAWEYETVYVPTGFYASFKDFAIAFDAAINAAIKKIFVRTNAHPNTSGIQQYSPEAYKKRFEFPGMDWLANKYLYNGNSNVDVLEAINIAFFPLETAIKALQDDDFKKVMGQQEPGKEYKIPIPQADKVWVSLTVYARKDAPEVAALTIVEAFAKDTNFSMKINRHMQHQLGFTLSPLHDMGWVRWYARKKQIETTIIPSLYWYGDSPPDLMKNPLKSINVHCDIIEGSYVGKCQMPLLRIVPVNIFTHQISYESLSVLQHRHINKNNVGTITIWLSETLGGEVLELRSAVFVKLQFMCNG
jgi:hypothetical protein